MNLGGLSADKAPPVEAPLTLIYLLPVFLVLAGSTLAWHGEQAVASRWTPAALGVTHFLVLGALAPAMCGALLQISPVLLGSPFPHARLIASATATGLGLGALGIGLGFLWPSAGLLIAGGAAVTIGLGIFLGGAFLALASPDHAGPGLWAVRLATIALAITAALGLLLAMAHNQWISLPNHLYWVNTHAAWGVGGWIGLLLAGIGMEIIPMFYVAPAFPRLARYLLPATIFLVLAMTIIVGIASDRPSIGALLGALFGVHALYNLIALFIEQRRRRRSRDANLWLWQVSHAGLLTAAGAWLGGLPDTFIGVLLIGSALAFVVGSLTKIVPFLSWLDLQQRRISTKQKLIKLPHMHTLFPPRRAALIAALLIAAITCTLAGLVVAPLAHAGGVLLAGCGILLASTLSAAAGQCRSVARQLKGASGPRRSSDGQQPL
jgi:hypothetical protein